MAKYKVNWEEVDSKNSKSLIEAVARYASNSAYQRIEDIFSILGIEKVEDSEGDV